MTHHLLEQLAHQRRETLAARARDHRPAPDGDTPPQTRRTTTRRTRSLARLTALVSRS
jgi:hypothetical protein